VALAKSQRASVILMDDGFQNPSVAKDASLIVIDSERGLGNGRVLPAGPLRAPLKPQLARTDALVVVGDGGASAEVAAAVAATGGQVFVAQLKPDETSLAALRGKRLLAFAGIGDPERFFRSLRACALEVVREHAFADHHVFSESDLDALQADARADQLTLVTTEKDLARLRGGAEPPAFGSEIAVLAVTLEFADAAKLRKFLARALFKAREKRFSNH
jgi:tetraacyldisaccharide 4'-kinase